MLRTSFIVLAVLASLALINASCADTAEQTPDPCGFDGELHTTDAGERYCSWAKTAGAVQESGFICPPQMQNYFESAQAFICAEFDKALPGWTPSDLASFQQSPEDPGPDTPGDDPVVDPPETGTEPPAANALDVLLVVDNSASMCQEQAALAAAVEPFVTSLEGVDYQIAVVTTDMLSPDHLGQFRHHKTTEFPFACAEQRIMYCLRGDDQACIDEMGSENWICDAPDKQLNITNCNGSLNSKCRKLCTADAECDTEFLGGVQGGVCEADPTKCRYKCLAPSGDPNNSGCVLRPESGGCPDSDELPSIFTPDTAMDLLPCVSTVGAEQHNNANLEQGLGAAVNALDPNGPNAAQAKGFLREGARLLVVFVSDEDDCSVKAGSTLKKQFYGTCTCLPDEDEDPEGKLASPAKLAAQLKSVKADPSLITVAAIVGDSKATGMADITVDRESYMASKCTMCANPAEEHPILFNTYICSSDSGKADLGSRYISFVQEFGAQGHLYNICDTLGFAPALAEIGQQIAETLKPTP